MKWYCYFAFKQLFPSGRRCPFFSLMSIIGVALGVMVLFVVKSVMDGFQGNIRRTMVETMGDVRIGGNAMIHAPAPMIDALNQCPEVKAVAPFAWGMVMLTAGNRPAFPLIKGIDTHQEPSVINIRSFIHNGDFEDLNDDTIILSHDLATKLQVTIGDWVDVYSPAMFESAINGEEIDLAKTLTVAGIYETGFSSADHNIALVTLPVMQELYQLHHGIHGIAVKLKPGQSPERFADRINHHFHWKDKAYSWEEMNEDFLFALKTEKTMMMFVLMFILLIATFSITNSLTMSVVKKTREIGVLRAMGGSAWQCACSFWLQGLMIGAMGGVLGIVAGITVLHYRDQIVSIFVKWCGIDDFMLRFYSFAHMPAQYDGKDIIILWVLAIVMCGIAGLLPAWRAAKIQPAEALRNE